MVVCLCFTCYMWLLGSCKETSAFIPTQNVLPPRLAILSKLCDEQHFKCLLSNAINSYTLLFRESHPKLCLRRDNVQFTNVSSISCCIHYFNSTLLFLCYDAEYYEKLLLYRKASERPDNWCITFITLIFAIIHI